MNVTVFKLNVDFRAKMTGRVIERQSETIRFEPECFVGLKHCFKGFFLPDNNAVLVVTLNKFQARLVTSSGGM